MTCRDCINYDICGEEKPNGSTIRAVCKANEWKLFKDKSHFVELPCKVGDTVYVTDNDVITEWTVKNVGITAEQPGFGIERGFELFGKTVFLTKEDAEKALEEM